MKTNSKKVNRYPGHDKSLLHLTVTPWLKERYEKVLAEGNKKRIAKYKGIDVLDFVIEQPLAIFREDGYFHSTIVARKNGMAFPDPKIKFKTFEDFLTKIDPNKKIYQNPDIPTTIDKETIETLAQKTKDFPVTPNYYLTKFSDTGNFALLVFSDSLGLNLSEIFKTIFNEFDFEEIKGTAIEEEDSNYPKASQESINGYIVGNVVVKELLLLEKEVKIEILNINLIKQLIDVLEHYYNGKFKYNGKITYSSKKG